MVQYTDRELLDELQRCYDENGEVSGIILNDSKNNYPTQPTYSYRFGSFSNALEAAGLGDGGPTRDDIIDATVKYFEENGYITLSHFSKEDSLPSQTDVYNKFDSANDLYHSAAIYDELMKERAKRRNNSAAPNDYTREELIEYLWGTLSKCGRTTTAAIDSTPGPSSTVYRNEFGSVEDARAAAGLPKTKYKKNYKDIFGELPDSCDLTADAHVYVISLRKGEVPYFYVGMSNNIERRLTQHASGKSKIMFHHDSGTVDTMENHGLLPDSIVRVEDYNKRGTETEKEFRERLKSEEHIISYEVAVGLNTSNILGGRS